jgi:hypothetical protein
LNLNFVGKRVSAGPARGLNYLRAAANGNGHHEGYAQPNGNGHANSGPNGNSLHKAVGNGHLGATKNGNGSQPGDRTIPSSDGGRLREEK